MESNDAEPISVNEPLWAVLMRTVLLYFFCLKIMKIPRLQWQISVEVWF